MHARARGHSRSVLLLACGLALACAREEDSPAAVGGAAGAAASGGAASGGARSGGASTGGASSGGSSTTGGAATGGVGTGGAAMGGTATGGVEADGGTATGGGIPAGGGPAGGAAGSNASQGGAGTGGAASGGEVDGGAAGSTASPGGEAGSNTAQGGGAPGGAATGGAAPGGAGTGGGAGLAAGGGAAGAGCGGAAPLSYDDVVRCDRPVGYWAMSHDSGTEPELAGNLAAGTYHGGPVAQAELPNGDLAARFDGRSQYLSIPSDPRLSIPTTGSLTWEAWISPSVVNFANVSSGYVDWMGKCEEYSPTCEWEARLYNQDVADRCSRLSAYAFNPSAGLGSGAYFQLDCGVVTAGAWYHVVGQYTTLTQPAGCSDTDAYPGAIDIWVNGVKWNQSTHGQTGCMSQYQVVPAANDSAVNVGTMSLDSWFEGAIGKLAIYDTLLTGEQIAAHYRAMTGDEPSGSCESSCTF